MPSSLVEPNSRDDFSIAIICALPVEYDAVVLVFDAFWDDDGDRFGRAVGDDNQYTTGRIGKYNVVLALLAHMGKAPAASAAASMRSSYRALKLALLVGICGGVPSVDGNEVLLGDVIISKHVVQHEFGRLQTDRFVRKDTIEDNLGRANKDVRTLVAVLSTDRSLDKVERHVAAILKELQAAASKSQKRQIREKYQYPGTEKDKLFEASYRHKHHDFRSCVCTSCFLDVDPICDEALQSSCDKLGCGADNLGNLVRRDRLEDKRQLEQKNDSAAQNPVFWVGPIASGDMVIKSARDRDRIAEQTDAIAFEMEGAGVWDEIPCIVCKGVADYADSHKNKAFQNWAAATAAATAKAILGRYVQTDTNQSGQGGVPKAGGQRTSDILGQGLSQTWGNITGHNIVAGNQTTGGSFTFNS